MKPLVAIAFILGTLVLPSWAQQQQQQQQRNSPLSEQEEVSKWHGIRRAVTRTLTRFSFQDDNRLLGENETNYVDNEGFHTIVPTTEGDTEPQGKSNETSTTAPSVANQTQGSVVPTVAPTITEILAPWTSSPTLDIVHAYRSGAYVIAHTASVDCDSILSTSWFTGTCCSLSELDEKCTLSVNDGFCKTVGPYWSLEFVSTAEDGCPVSEFEVPIAILDTELPVTTSPSASPSTIDEWNGTSLAPTLAFGLLEQPEFCADQGNVSAVACLNDTMGGEWYAVIGTGEDALLQIEWDCNETSSFGDASVHVLKGNDCSQLECVASGVLDPSVCDLQEPTRRLRPRGSVPSTSTSLIFHAETNVSYFVLLETEESLTGVPLLLSDCSEDTITIQPSVTPPPTPMSSSTAMPTVSVNQSTVAPSAMPSIDDTPPPSTPKTNVPSQAPTAIVTKQSSLSAERKWFGVGIMLISLLVVVFC